MVYKHHIVSEEEKLTASWEAPRIQMIQNPLHINPYLATKFLVFEWMNSYIRAGEEQEAGYTVDWC